PGRHGLRREARIGRARERSRHRENSPENVAMSQPFVTPQLESLLRARIVVLDGAMGTMIQRRKPTEADYRGKRFTGHAIDLKGDNELLNLTRPDLIRAVHGEYFAAGADIVETNTFGATSIAQADYDLSELAYELNRAGAEL